MKILKSSLLTLFLGSLAVTGGQFLVEAYKNGQQLSASPQYNLNAEIPTNEPEATWIYLLASPTWTKRLIGLRQVKTT